MANTQQRIEFQETNSAFGNRIREFDLVNMGFKHIQQFMMSAFDLYEEKITESVRQYNMIKTLSYFIVELERAFENPTNSQYDPIFEKRTVYITTLAREIDYSTDIEDHFQSDIVNYSIRKIDEVMIEGSGFTVSRIDRLRVQIFKYEPLNGAGDWFNIPLPRHLKNKKAVLSLKNTHDECFKWSILAALHHREVPVKKANDAASYVRWTNELNFDGINFPVQLKQIEQFMQQNVGLAVNVYYFDELKKRVCPLSLAMKPVEYKYVHLLLLRAPKPMQRGQEVFDVDNDSHYCCIKNLNSLVGSQLTKHEHKVSICDRCLVHFSSQEKLEKHKSLCANVNDCAIEMPRTEMKDARETFKNHKNELKIPFIVYADTETLMKAPETEVFSSDCATTAHNQHEVHSIGYYFKSDVDELSSYYASNRSVNCLNWFMDELTDIAMNLFEFLEDKKPMKPLTPEEEKTFLNATICHICKKQLNNVAIVDGDNDNESKQCVRVRDHCHLTGRYRGAAHQACNLNYQISRSIPVVMHNLSGYDSHLLIKKLATSKDIPGDITIIPHNSEKYIAFIKKMDNVGCPFSFRRYSMQVNFKFIDSLRFMSASLDHLAALVPAAKKSILKAECIKSGHCTDEMFTLLNRKGVFPYEYIDSYEKLREPALPAKEHFFSMLTQSSISDADYTHAQNVWNVFNLRTLGEYSDLYLKTDVLLLADVFENFRATCHAAYSLDPAHYFGAPGLSFDAMLKYTGVSIDLFTDVDMLMFAEQGIRGGICQVNKRYVKANNKYMDDEYDRTKESTYLMYLDGKQISLCDIFNMHSISHVINE